jgi:hypothetical protein
MAHPYALSPNILEILDGTELANNPVLFRCPTCYSKRHNVYFEVVSPEIAPCCYRLTCFKHSPPQHKFICVKHASFFMHRKSLLRHERLFFCGTALNEVEEAPGPFVGDPDAEYPMDNPEGVDFNQADETIPSLTRFQNLPSFTSFPPNTTVEEHFCTGPGINLSSNSQRFFVDELSQPGSGAKRLVANAFNPQAHLLNDDELPSCSETYVHLLIASFLLTLTMS